MNILFITADQWRGECLGAAGHGIAQTPSLDALARDGVRFARHYANTAPCAPSRAGMHTGMYAHNHRVIQNGTPLARRHGNWALEARKAGWRPVLFGYTDTSMDPRGVAPDNPWLATLDGILPGIEAVAPSPGDMDPWPRWLGEQGFGDFADSEAAMRARRKGTEYEDGGAHPLPAAYPKEASDTHFLVDRLLDWLRRGEHGGRPWIAHLSLLRPHPPWVAPEPYNRLHDPADMPPPARAASLEEEGRQHPWLAWKLSGAERRAIDRKRFPQSLSLKPAPADIKKLARWKAVYYGLMREVDDNLGRLFAFLKQHGLYDSTLILFTSDHGEQMGDHWLKGKGGYFDASYHVPLLLRDPRPEADATRGTAVSAFTEHVDIMPTLLDYIGADIPRQCDGRSLRRLAETGTAPAGWREAVHWEQDFRLPGSRLAEERLGLSRRQCVFSVIRDERRKYVHFAGLPPLLFDLDEDGGEFVDRSSDPSCRPLLLEYAGRLLDWRMTHAEQELTDCWLTPQGVFWQPEG